ncbi:MAG: DUF72 domain-containing protein [Candidatus Zixiibacteriota bacterium]
MSLKDKVEIGLSGFRFDSDKKVFYPKGLQQNRFIEYYAKHFTILEINSTYYGLPSESVFERFNRLTPQDFKFIVKLPGSMTHERINPKSDYGHFIKLLHKIDNPGKLKGLLAQFPQSFRNNKKNIEYIKSLKRLFAGHIKGDNLYIEFRHESWLDDKIFKMLQQENMGIVSVDEPDLPELMTRELINTTDEIYLRLHSRNKEKWYEGRDERYNYYYSEDEIREIIKKLDRKTKDRMKALVFFNNCHRGSAVKNAEKMKLLLGQDFGPPNLGF